MTNRVLEGYKKLKPPKGVKIAKLRLHRVPRTHPSLKGGYVGMNKATAKVLGLPYPFSDKIGLVAKTYVSHKNEVKKTNDADEAEIHIHECLEYPLVKNDHWHKGKKRYTINHKKTIKIEKKMGID